MVTKCFIISSVTWGSCKSGLFPSHTAWTSIALTFMTFSNVSTFAHRRTKTKKIQLPSKSCWISQKHTCYSSNLEKIRWINFHSSCKPEKYVNVTFIPRPAIKRTMCETSICLSSAFISIIGFEGQYEIFCASKQWKESLACR